MYASSPTKTKRPSARKAGKRYPLLIYQRYMDRLWQPTLALGLLLAAIWALAWFTPISILQPGNEMWLFVGAAGCLSFSLFALLARRVAYLQFHGDHLRLVTPFLRLNISYRRIRSVRSADFTQLFPPQKSSWAERSFLEPYYGRTVIVVELSAYPLPRGLLRLFLAPQMFSRQVTGFVLIVPDWMSFSAELDSRVDEWRRTQSR
jgi:hypothetical protein